MSDRSAIFYYVARIQEDGSAVAVDLTQRVEAFNFVDRENGMDRLTLTVDNKDLANFDDPLFETGASLRVAWGNGLSSAPPRDMLIKKVTGGRSLSVECVSKDGSSIDTIKKRRVLHAMTRSDVVRQIARECGFLNPDIEDTYEVFNELSQGNLTDGQFLRKLAHLEGFEFYIDWEGLHWHRRRVGQAPIREYIYFIDPQGGEVIDFNVENDVTRRPGKVTVKSRDPYAKEDIEASASNSEDPDRDVMQGIVGVIDGETGQLTLSQEAVSEQTVASNVESQTDAEQEAKGKFRKAAQGVVKMTLKLIGDPSLVAKSIITLKGFGKRLSGKYYVKEITHELTASGGYDMTLKLITDGYQSKGKGGDENADSASNISAMYDSFEAALLEDFASGVSGETGELLADIDQLNAASAQGKKLLAGLRALAGQQGDQLRANARLAASAFRKYASHVNRIMPTAASSARDIAAQLAVLAEGPTEVEAQGKKNTKTVKDSSVTPVESIDVDGNVVTTYIDTGGRTK